jgi:hypothetical protein
VENCGTIRQKSNYVRKEDAMLHVNPVYRCLNSYLPVHFLSTFLVSIAWVLEGLAVCCNQLAAGYGTKVKSSLRLIPNRRKVY